jgi:hypothetical protein
VTFLVTLCLVLFAVYGLASLLLTILVAFMWRAAVGWPRLTSSNLLALRLLPAGGAILVAVAVVLPAFLIYEPAREMEDVGAGLLMLVLFALIEVGDGVRRGWRAYVATRSLLRCYGPPARLFASSGQRVAIVNVSEPIAAVVGGWRPRLVASKRVLTVCSQDEFRQVIAHEAAHISSGDNLKLLLLIMCPDALAWLPTGGTLVARWRAAVELEADERAAGSDRHKRLALAAALIKVARLSVLVDREFPTLTMPIALDDVEGRVRQLLAPSEPPRKANIKAAVACALLAPVLAVPLYGLVQQFVEVLVAFGR